MRHHLNSRIKNFFAGQQELCIATAKKLRKEMSEVLIDLVVGLLQQIPGFTINFANRILKRLHRLGQIRALQP